MCREAESDKASELASSRILRLSAASAHRALFNSVAWFQRQVVRPRAAFINLSFVEIGVLFY
jgi:hypothetical protein